MKSALDWHFCPFQAVVLASIINTVFTNIAHFKIYIKCHIIFSIALFNLMKALGILKQHTEPSFVNQAVDKFVTSLCYPH